MSVLRRRPVVKVDAQGSVLAVAVPEPPNGQERKGGGKRGEVTSFSSASRRRLIRLAARLEQRQGLVAAFIGLTYPPEVGVCPHCAKKHLRAFIRRLERHCIRLGRPVGLVWRIEAQANGRPHFHLLAYMPYVDKEELKMWWAEIIAGDCGPALRRAFDHGARIEAVRDHGKVRGYVSKTLAYIAKDEQGEGREADAGACVACGLDTGAYWDRPGRFWGVVGREHLPWADQFTDEWASGRWFWRWRRAARRKWKGVGCHGQLGFVLYTQDVGAWVALGAYFMGQEGASSTT